MTEKMLRSASSAAAMRPAVTGGHGQSFRSGRSRVCNCHRQVRSSGARCAVTSSMVEVQLAQQQLEHLRADSGLHLDANRAAEAPAAQLHLDRREQVFGVLVFKRQVDVAGDSEDGMLLDHHAGEQAVQLGGDELLGGEEPNAVGQADQPREHGRHLDPGESSLAGIGITDHRREAERQVGDVRERVGRVDGQRREHREDPLLEDIDQVRPVGVVEVVPADDLDARCRRAPARARRARPSPAR